MLLIFDCDGVLIDSTILHTEAEARCFQALGIAITQQELKTRFAGVSDSDVFQALQRESGIKLPADMKDRLDKEKHKLFAEKLKAIDGMHDILPEIGKIPSCVASGSSVEMLRYTLTLTKLYDFFHPRIYSSDMVPRGKPFPDLFLYAAAQMGESPENSIIIEDSVAGVRAGVAAGSWVIGFVGGSHCDANHATALTEAGAGIILSSMRDLPATIQSYEALTKRKSAR